MSDAEKALDSENVEDERPGNDGVQEEDAPGQEDVDGEGDEPSTKDTEEDVDGEGEKHEPIEDSKDNVDGGGDELGKHEDSGEESRDSMKRVTDLLSALENASLPAGLAHAGWEEKKDEEDEAEENEEPSEGNAGDEENDDDDDAQSIPTSVDSEDDGPITHAIPKDPPKPKPKPLPNLDFDMQSVVDFLDVVQQSSLPDEVLKKLAEKKKKEEKKAEPAPPRKKVGKAKGGPLSVKLAKQKELKAEVKEEVVEQEAEESRSFSDETNPSKKNVLTRNAMSSSRQRKVQVNGNVDIDETLVAGGSEWADPHKPTIPRAGKGYWNLFRTAHLINRALDASVEGVDRTEPYNVYANSKVARGRANDPRGVIACRGRIGRPKSVRSAYQWLRTAPCTEARLLEMKGPFDRRGPPSGRPFDPKNFGLPRMCSLSLGKYEEPGGPGVQLGFPVDHGWPEDAIPDWENRPMSLQLLESTAAEMERLSNVQSVALETLFSGLKRFSDRHPELKEELEEFQPTIQDIRDLDYLFANRAVVNFDIITKTSKKMVMDAMKVDMDTFSRYWSQPPSRVLFPDVSNVRNFRPVQPDLRAIEEEVRLREEEEIRRLEEEERRLREEDETRRREEGDFNRGGFRPDDRPPRDDRKRPGEFYGHGGPDKRRRTNSPPRGPPERNFEDQGYRGFDRGPPRGAYSPPRDFPDRDEGLMQHGGPSPRGRGGMERGRMGRGGFHEGRGDRGPRGGRGGSFRGNEHRGDAGFDDHGDFNARQFGDDRGGGYQDQFRVDRGGSGFGDQFGDHPGGGPSTAGFRGDRFDNPSPSSSRDYPPMQNPEQGQQKQKDLLNKVQRLLAVAQQSKFAKK